MWTIYIKFLPLDGHTDPLHQCFTTRDSSFCPLSPKGHLQMSGHFGVSGLGGGAVVRLVEVSDVAKDLTLPRTASHREELSGAECQ